MLPYSRYPTAADHRYGDANPEHSPHTHQPTYWTPYADAYNAGTQYPMQQQDAYAHSPIAEGYGQPHASSYAQSACRRDDSPSNAHSAMSSQINYTAPPYDFREFPAPQYAEPQYPNHHVDPPYHQYGISPAPHPAYFAEGAYPSQSYPSSTPFPKLNLYEPTDVRSSSEPRPEQQFPDHMHYRYGDDPPTPQQSTPSPVAPRSTGLTGPINTRFYSPSSQFRKHKIYESSEYDARSPASELSNATYPPASDYDPQSPPEPHLIQQFPSDPYSYVELPRHAVPPVTKQSTSSELGNALQEPLPPPRKFVSPPREPMVRSQSTSSMPSERAPSPPMDHLPFPEDAEQKERLESAVRKQFDGIVGTRKKVGSNADHKQVVQSPSTASQSEPIQHDHPEGVACTHSDAVAPTPTRGPPPLAHAHTAPLPIPTKPLTPVLPPPPHRESFYLVQDPAAYPEFAALRKRRAPAALSIPNTASSSSHVHASPLSATSTVHLLSMSPTGRKGPTVSKAPHPKRPRKKPALACLFCRERKIACGPPVPGSNDPSCNQCARRQRKCEYPTESRRGQHKRQPRNGGQDEPEDGPQTPPPVVFAPPMHSA